MADYQKTTHIMGQVEYDWPAQEATHILGQVEFLTSTTTTHTTTSTTTTVEVRDTQMPVEVMYRDTAPEIRDTQLPIEVMYRDDTPELRDTQLVIEVLEAKTSSTTTTTTTSHYWSEDFEGMVIDDPPTGWTETWDTANVITSVKAAKGAKSMLLDKTSNAKIAVTRNGVNRARGELLALVQAKDAFSTFAGGVGARISGGVGTETGYVVFMDPADNKLKLRRYNNGTSSDRAEASKTIDADRWYWIRLRLDGAVIKAKLWGKMAAEPGAWDIDHTDTSPVTAAGEWGVCTFNADVYCEHIIYEHDSTLWPIAQPDYMTTTTTTSTTTTTTTTGTTTTAELVCVVGQGNGQWANSTTSNLTNFGDWIVLFDGSTGGGTTVGYGGQPYWLYLELPKAYTIKKIRIYSTGVNVRDIKAFDLQGSNTGAFGGEEDTLLQVTNQTGWSYEWREWAVDNDTAYKYYRIANIAGNNIYWINLYEFELYAPSNEVLSFKNDCTGEATMSAGTGTPANCVDDNLGTYWSTATVNDWLQAYFPAGKVINQITMQPTSVNSSRAPHDWTLLASNTGVFGGEEDTLLVVDGYGYDSANEKRYWQLGNVTSYKYYRFDPIHTNGSFYIYLAELEMMEEGIPAGTTTTTTTHTTTTATATSTTTTEAGAQYSTNWSGYTPDVAPDDFTERWEAPVAAITVKDNGGQYGAQYLLIDHSTFGHYMADWNDVGVAKDVDVLAKVQFNDPSPVTGQNYFSIVLRQTGGTSNKNGYTLRLFPFDDQIKAFKWVNNVASQIGPTRAKTLSTYWYWVRFQVIGNAVKAKVWAGQPSDEPGTWDIEVTDSAHAGVYGTVGLGSYNGDATWVDYFSVGVGGQNAPKPADYITTTTTTTTTTSTTTTGTTETPMEPATYISVGSLQGA